MKSTIMGDVEKKFPFGEGDKEILFSRTIRAGMRIYYLDVKRNLKNDLFIAVTESKRVMSKDESQSTFVKHKIFLYKEDFEKFIEGMNEVMRYVESCGDELISMARDADDALMEKEDR